MFASVFSNFIFIFYLRLTTLIFYNRVLNPVKFKNVKLLLADSKFYDDSFWRCVVNSVYASPPPFPKPPPPSPPPHPARSPPPPPKTGFSLCRPLSPCLSLASILPDPLSQSMVDHRSILSYSVSTSLTVYQPLLQCISLSYSKSASLTLNQPLLQYTVSAPLTVHQPLLQYIASLPVNHPLFPQPLLQFISLSYTVVYQPFLQYISLSYRKSASLPVYQPLSQ